MLDQGCHTMKKRARLYNKRSEIFRTFPRRKKNPYKTRIAALEKRNRPDVYSWREYETDLSPRKAKKWVNRSISHTHAHTHIYTHTYIYTHTHTYIYIYIYIYIYHHQVPDLEQTLAAMPLQTSLSSDNYIYIYNGFYC